MIDSFHCPECGHKMFLEDAPRELETMFPGLFGRIIQCLSKAREEGRAVKMPDLINYVYADDPEGGPVHAATTVSVTISRCREDLQAVGWDIYGPKITKNGFLLAKYVKQSGAN